MLKLRTSSRYFINALLAAASLVMTSELKAQTMSDSLNKLKVGIDFKPTKYKPGFKYTTNHGEKATLIKWVYSGDVMGIKTYRWRVKIEKFGISSVVWADDQWIDVSTGKAYLDERQHKIVYYSEQ